MAQRRKGQRKPKTEIQRSEEQFQRFIARRNEFNDESRMLRDERDALHEQRHKVMEQILALREEMKSNSRQYCHQPTYGMSERLLGATVGVPTCCHGPGADVGNNGVRAAARDDRDVDCPGARPA